MPTDRPPSGSRPVGLRMRAAAPGRQMAPSHAIGDGVVPEAVEPLKGPVHLAELLRFDPPDLLDGTDMAVIEPGDDLGHLFPFRRQADADRAAVDARTLVVDETHVDQLLQIVGYVRAEIVAARAEFAGREFRIADVEEKQSLDGIDVAAALAL